MVYDLPFFLAALPAVFLLGMSKGGFSGVSILALPLMSLTVPPLEAAAIILPILIVQDVISVWIYRESFSKPVVSILLAGGLAGIAAGALLAARVSNALVELIVGLVAAGFVLYSWAAKKGLDADAQRRRLLPGLFWGALAGFTSFIANAGGPPFQVYVIPLRLPPLIFAGTGAIFFAILNLIKMVVFYNLGQVTRGHLLTSAILVPPAIAATFLGVFLVRRTAASGFYKIIYGITLVVGLYLVFLGSRDLLR